nr:immunoglobulin light chain junction region [Macaca mulatta]
CQQIYSIPPWTF